MSKSFDKKDIFTIVTAEEAKAYTGKQGYFGNTLEDLEEEINKYGSDELEEIVHQKYTSNIFRPRGYESTYSLFLPDDKVKKDEKPTKWRAFKEIKEFIKTIGDIGTIITYRTKKEPSQEMRGMFTGFMWDSACRGWIIGIGSDLYRLENLFELTERKYNNNWYPFGIEE